MNTVLIKIAIAACLSLIPIGYSYWNIQSNKGVIQELRNTIASKDKKISDMDFELESKNNEIRSKNTEINILQNKISDFELSKKTNEAIDVSKQRLIETQKIIDDKVSIINKKYEGLQKTDANEQARKREITRERVKGLWLSYCIAYPDNERCKE